MNSKDDTKSFGGKENMISLETGIKVMSHTTKEYIEKMQNTGLVDYFEFYADSDIDLKKDIRLPVIKKPVLCVHVACEGSNFADSSKEEINLRVLLKAQEIADHFGSRKIIFHPELKDNCNCSVENLINFINKHINKDNRYRWLIENMPFSTEGWENFCKNYEEIKEVIDRTGVGFCLDFTHACEYARRMGIDIRNFILELLKLNPAHFHLADTDLSKVFDVGYDEVHLPLWGGNIGVIAFIRSQLHFISGVTVTLETPQRDLQKQVEEIKFLKNECAYPKRDELPSFTKYDPKPVH